MPEGDVKTLLCRKIDEFVEERIVAAGALIAQFALQKIVDGDVVLTFARSQVWTWLLTLFSGHVCFDGVVVDVTKSEQVFLSRFS